MPISDWAGGISQVVGTGLGLLLQKHNDRRQLQQQERLQALGIRGAKEMTDYQQRAQLEMWEKTGPTGQMEQLRKAGLNPSLIYGMGGAGGQTVGGGAAGVSQGSAPVGGDEIKGMGIMAQQAAMMGAQMDLIKAQADNVRADTEKKRGVDTDLAKSQIINNSLDAVIKEYTGKEAKAQFDIKETFRPEETRMYQDQITLATMVAQAMQNTTMNIEKMSDAQLQDALLKNAKTEQEIAQIKKAMDIMKEDLKGKQLSNVILELEKDLQTKTGLDRNSEGWLKILGRLFIGLSK